MVYSYIVHISLIIWSYSRKDIIFLIHLLLFKQSLTVDGIFSLRQSRAGGVF